MQSYHQSLQHVVRLHQDAAQYYKRCAFITTEPDLKTLFTQMARQRQEMACHLAGKAALNERKNLLHTGQIHLQQAASHFQHIWYSVKIALILNDRQRLLRYCTKVEADTWREYQRVTCAENLNEELFRLLTGQQQAIRTMMENVKEMPVIKYYMQKKAVA